MAIPSRQIGWGTEENLLWEISKQMESLICTAGCGTSSTGTSGTSGASGLSGTSGTSGVVGTSGTSGQSGTAGVNGTSGITGTSGVSGTSGTSPVFPFPTVFGLYAQTADSVDVNNTTTETTLVGSGVGTLTVGANQFAVGDSFRADLTGVMGAQNNETLRIRIKAGSIILADSGFQNLGAAISADVWSLSATFTIRAVGAAGVASVASLGVFNFTKTNNGTVEGFSFNTINNTTFDTTISNTLVVTVQWGAANVLNTIYSDIFVLNKTY